MASLAFNRPDTKFVQRRGLYCDGIAQYKLYYAVYNPRVQKSISSSEKKLIGKKFLWRASWIITSGEHRGEWGMILQDRIESPWAWRPSGDLKDITPKYRRKDVPSKKIDGESSATK